MSLQIWLPFPLFIRHSKNRKIKTKNMEKQQKHQSYVDIIWWYNMIHYDSLWYNHHCVSTSFLRFVSWLFAGCSFPPRSNESKIIHLAPSLGQCKVEAARETHPWQDWEVREKWATIQNQLSWPALMRPQHASLAREIPNRLNKHELLIVRSLSVWSKVSCRTLYHFDAFRN